MWGYENLESLPSAYDMGVDLTRSPSNQNDWQEPIRIDWQPSHTLSQENRADDNQKWAEANSPPF